MSEHAVMGLLATAVGLAARFGALGFRHLIEFFQSIAYGEQGDLLEVLYQTPGILSYSDYHHLVPNKDPSQLIIVKDMATPEVVTVYPEDSLYTALERITPNDFSILPVVSKGNPKKLLEILTRRDIIGAYNSAVIKKPILRE